jgi:hypothetical protein
VTDDLSKVVCEEYTEEEIEADFTAVEYETAYAEIERVESERRAKQLELIQNQERQKAKEEFEKIQQEEMQKSEQIRKQLEERQKEIERAQKEKEALLVAQQAEEKKKLEEELQKKEAMLKESLSEQERVRLEKEKEQILKQQLEVTMEQEKEKSQLETDKIKFEMEKELEKQQIELEMIRKQMEMEKDRLNKKMQEQKQAYEKKLKSDQQIKATRQKIRDVKKMVEEANEIAKLMKKDISFSVIYVSKFDNQSNYGSSGTDIEDMKTEIEIKVENFDQGQIYYWTTDKLMDKLIMMRDALQVYEDSSAISPEAEEDLFVEKQEPILLGQAFYLLEGLAYQLDNERTLPIASTTNQINGQLHINVVPCDEHGNEDLDEDMIPEDPMDMLNQPMDFKVKIDRITGLPEDFCSNIYCEYKFYLDDNVYKTPVSEGRNRSPEFKFERQHHVDCVTKYMVQYLLEDKMTIKIYGNQDLKKKAKTDRR